MQALRLPLIINENSGHRVCTSCRERSTSIYNDYVLRVPACFCQLSCRQLCGKNAEQTEWTWACNKKIEETWGAHEWRVAAGVEVLVRVARVGRGAHDALHERQKACRGHRAALEVTCTKMLTHHLRPNTVHHRISYLSKSLGN